MKTFLKVVMALLGLRLIFSVIFEDSSLVVGFIGTGLAVVCIISLVQQFRNRDK